MISAKPWPHSKLVPPALSMPPLAMKGVSVAYGNKLALADIDLELPVGAVVGLAGANGMGKSSLIRCMLGLVRPRTGTVSLFGESPHALSNSARERLGYVSQSPELLEWMTVGQHLDYMGAFYTFWDTERIEAWCKAWNLNLRRRVSALSLGEKQKLSLLLALGHAPDLLILDEPVASLDPLMRREFMRTLFDQVPERTVLISSHLLSDLERVITHLVLMKDGRVLLLDEWDAMTESLCRVVSPHLLPAAPGVLVQRQENGQTSAVIDTRRFAIGDLPSGARHMGAMNLEELYVELLS